jgi:hypothetical protein
MVGASLDCFIVITNILFMPKRARLANPKSGHKLCPKDDHLKSGRFGFMMVTVFVKMS